MPGLTLLEVVSVLTDDSGDDPTEELPPIQKFSKDFLGFAIFQTMFSRIHAFL